MNYSFDEARLGLELFHSGRAFHAYEYFGANVDNSNGVQGIIFRVWAPNAKSVSVVGDFNSWNTTADYMTKSESGCWELFSDKAKLFDCYKFCIETQESERIFKSDPFAVYSRTNSENASIIYDINKYKWNDGEYINQRNSRDNLCEPMNIYEMHLGSWKRFADGTSKGYRDIADELVEYLKSMNYTHI